MKANSFFEAYKKLPPELQVAFLASCFHANINPGELFHILGNVWEVAVKCFAELISALNDLHEAGILPEEFGKYL